MYIDVFQFVTSPIIIIAGLFPVVMTGLGLKIPVLRIIALYIWHTIFTIIYSFYVVNNGGDALSYFDVAGNFDFNNTSGNLGVIIPSALLREIFDLSFLNISFIFGMLGTIGLLFLDASIKLAVLNKKKWLRVLSTIIVFLPSVSFWSAGLGKDSLSFLSTCMCLWAALKFNKRQHFFVLSISIMFFVRPHIAGFMLIAFLVVVLVESRATIARKVLIGTTAASAAAVMIPFALTYVGFGDEINIGSLIMYIDMRQSYNMEGYGGIDISMMSFPEQLFAYMFRPLFFEINSVFSAAAAFDNFILLLLFIVGGWAMLKGRQSGLGESRLFMWIYALVCWVVLAMTTANMGIALRQKWMFAPMLIFLFISVIGSKKKHHF